MTGTGIYNVYGGRLATGRPFYIGAKGKDEASGRGEVHVYGGKVDLSGGSVHLYRQGDGSTTGLFHVSGSEPKSISRPRGWKQRSNGRLKFNIDAGGVTPIEVNNRKYSNNVTFREGATLDVSFLDDSARAGSWDVMTWQGKLTDKGLSFADTVDKETWNFYFVDTEGDGSPDTLRVSAIPELLKRPVP